MSDREVTEFDLRADKWRHPSIKVDDLERDGDGDIVRKDRFVTTCWAVARALGNESRRIVLDEVVSEAERAHSARSILNELHAVLSQSVNAPKPDGLNDLQRGVDSGKWVVLETLEKLAAEHDYQFSIPSQGTDQ